MPRRRHRKRWTVDIGVNKANVTIPTPKYWDWNPKSWYKNLGTYSNFPYRLPIPYGDDDKYVSNGKTNAGHNQSVNKRYNVEIPCKDTLTSSDVSNCHGCWPGRSFYNKPETNTVAGKYSTTVGGSCQRFRNGIRLTTEDHQDWYVVRGSTWFRCSTPNSSLGNRFGDVPHNTIGTNNEIRADKLCLWSWRYN